MEGIASAVNPGVPRSATVAEAIEDFLALLRAKKTKPRSYNEAAYHLEVIKEWLGFMDVASIDETTVKETYKRVARLDVAHNTKNKRWQFWKRLVRFLFEEGKLTLPRNLSSRLYSFKQQIKAIRTFPLETVKAELAKLPDQFRLWALLGLNCGMTNSDISALTKDMVTGGYLTRRRVKTGDNADVPTVAYKVWKETVSLLQAFKSNHPTLWLTGANGTALVDTRLDGENFKCNDQIGQKWKRYGKCPIPVSKFRNIAATTLETHETYGRYVEHFLAHVPNTITSKYYAAPSQEVFDKALKWLHDKLFS